MSETERSKVAIPSSFAITDTTIEQTTMPNVLNLTSLSQANDLPNEYDDDILSSTLRYDTDTTTNLYYKEDEELNLIDDSIGDGVKDVEGQKTMPFNDSANPTTSEEMITVILPVSSKDDGPHSEISTKAKMADELTEVSLIVKEYEDILKEYEDDHQYQNSGDREDSNTSVEQENNDFEVFSSDVDQTKLSQDTPALDATAEVPFTRQDFKPTVKDLDMSVEEEENNIQQPLSTSVDQNKLRSDTPAIEAAFEVSVSGNDLEQEDIQLSTVQSLLKLDEIARTELPEVLVTVEIESNDPQTNTLSNAFSISEIPSKSSGEYFPPENSIIIPEVLELADAPVTLNKAADINNISHVLLISEPISNAKHSAEHKNSTEIISKEDNLPVSESSSEFTSNHEGVTENVQETTLTPTVGEIILLKDPSGKDFDMLSPRLPPRTAMISTEPSLTLHQEENENVRDPLKVLENNKTPSSEEAIFSDIDQSNQPLNTQEPDLFKLIPPFKDTIKDYTDEFVLPASVIGPSLIENPFLTPIKNTPGDSNQAVIKENLPLQPQLIVNNLKGNPSPILLGSHFKPLEAQPVPHIRPSDSNRPNPQLPQYLTPDIPLPRPAIWGHNNPFNEPSNDGSNLPDSLGGYGVPQSLPLSNGVQLAIKTPGYSTPSRPQNIEINLQRRPNYQSTLKQAPIQSRPRPAISDPPNTIDVVLKYPARGRPQYVHSNPATNRPPAISLNQNSLVQHTRPPHDGPRPTYGSDNQNKRKPTYSKPTKNKSFAILDILRHIISSKARIAKEIFQTKALVARGILDSKSRAINRLLSSFHKHTKARPSYHPKDPGYNTPRPNYGVPRPLARSYKLRNIAENEASTTRSTNLVTAIKDKCNLVKKDIRGNFILESPEYPEDYNNFINCSVRIKAKKGACYIRLNLIDFILEDSLYCSQDYLVIKNSKSIDEPRRMCGQHSGKTLTLKSTSDSYWELQFRTDHSGATRGFHIAVHTIHC